MVCKKEIINNDIQAITKVKAAIKGYKNGRLDDLAMMTSMFKTRAWTNFNIFTFKSLPILEW